MTSGPTAPLMLSVSGARGIVGETMTPDVARRFAFAFGSILRASVPLTTPLVVLGRDSRPSGASLLDAAAEGLIASGCRAIDLGIVMTPTVGVMIGECGAQGGMVVTASHNPAQWNGLKCLNADGVAPPARDAAHVIDLFRSGTGGLPRADRPSSIRRIANAADVHVGRVLRAIGRDRVEAIRAHRFRVVVDSVCGAGGPAAAAMLAELGCAIVHLHADSNGAFPHLPEPVRENLGELMRAVPRERAAVGFAQDPDADRLAIVDEGGRYIGEEYTLALCACRALERHAVAEQGVGATTRHGNQGIAGVVLAANLSTSRMIDDIAAMFPDQGAVVLRTAVGEANVVEAMKPCGPRALLGGEGNGGVIFPPVCWVRDSLSSMALVLDLMVARDAPLSAIVDGLPRYEMIKSKFDLAAVGGREAVDSALARVRAAFASERVSDADGIRIDVADGWVHLRPSNTEPIVRLIAEARTRLRAEALIGEVRAAARL